MRRLTLTAGITMLALPLCAAQSAVISIGSALSRSCYHAALSEDDSNFALDECTRALTEAALSPTDRAATYVNRGILRMVRGKDADADADFDSALALNQDLPDAWLNKGFLRVRRGDGRNALPLLQQGIDRKPERQALAIFARGVAYEEIGEYRSAYEDLSRAHQLEPHWSLPREYLSHYRVVSQ